MKEIQKNFGLKRINSIILLQALLEEKYSLLYDFLCATSEGATNPYKNIIQDCNNELRRIKKSEKLDGSEKYFKINMPDGEDPIEATLTDELYNVVVNTMNDLINLEHDKEDESAAEESENKITISVTSEDILLSFANDMPKEPLTILKNNGVYLDGFMEYYELLEEIYETNEVESSDGDCQDAEKIPKTLSDFVTVLSSKYKGGS